jgi:thiol-disulfide isomerase/thioredoxin
MLNLVSKSGKAGMATAALLIGMLILLIPGFAPASAASSRYDFRAEEITTGETLTMTQLADKPLIVHIWSPECPHCQRHMPYLVAFYRKLDTDKVNFVTCAMDASQRETEKYITAKHLQFPVLYGTGGKISDSFSAKGWPTTFVFAPGGKLIGTCDTQSSGYVSEMLDLVDKALNE